jgi:2-polyprenyl-3-methyl-5-hydroxy-6-metoxy-1,4-benzoquinol methylase
MKPNVAHDFRFRQLTPEIMDQPGLALEEHVGALKGLARINAISRSGSVLYNAVADLAAQDPQRTLRILDVACGGGENTIALASRASQNGLPIHIEGCDISPQAVAFAQSMADSKNLGINFHVRDALGENLPTGYDVILCSLFLHHLDEYKAKYLLRSMRESAQKMVLVDDLIRSRRGYLMAWVGCRLLSRSQVVHYDGPVSVKAAFRIDEVKSLASEAGLDNITVKRHWPERYLLRWTNHASINSDD